MACIMHGPIRGESPARREIRLKYEREEDAWRERVRLEVIKDPAVQRAQRNFEQALAESDASFSQDEGRGSGPGLSGQPNQHGTGQAQQPQR